MGGREGSLILTGGGTLIHSFVIRVLTGPGNLGKYFNFSPPFSRTGKSLKMIAGPGIPWNFVNSSNKVFLKDIEEQRDGKI